MTTRTVLYARVSTDEQAERGYSLESQIEACRDYAQAHGLEVQREIADNHSGAKLDRPGLDELRAAIETCKIEAVVIHSPDRLTRNLAHSLILREEFQRAGVELHYCNRGKSEDTPESRMQENIEAVFADYWRAKIIESSRRGRRKKAANGKWPCDGHAAYGYRKVGKGREASLEINEREAAVLRRIFALYIGEFGRPVTLQAIAAKLTAEKVPPPNRGVGKKRKGKGWHRATIRRFLMRRAYIGEFRYGGIDVDLPELAIISRSTFRAAERRRKKSQARAIYQRKYDFLLAGHIRCACHRGMSADPMQRGRYRYYTCNGETNSKHLSDCEELRVNADDAERIVWDWLTGLLCDQEQLELGLRRLTERRKREDEPIQERLALVEELLADVEGKIKRLATAFAQETDETIAAAFHGELKAASREREALLAERGTLAAKLKGVELTAADIATIQDMALQIRAKLANPTFEQKRELLNLLDLQIELEWKKETRGIQCTCGLKLTPRGEKIPTWKSLSSLGRKYPSSTMM